MPLALGALLLARSSFRHLPTLLKPSISFAEPPAEVGALSSLPVGLELEPVVFALPQVRGRPKACLTVSEKRPTSVPC